MKHSHLIRLTFLLVPLIALMFSCTDRAVDNGSDYSIKIQMNPGFEYGELAEMVNLVCLTVTAADMEPVESCQLYSGGPVTFEIDIPSGQNRLFVLQGISQLEVGQLVLYEGRAIANVEPNVALELVIQVEPIVPLIRFTPFHTELQPTGKFQLKVEAFNLPNLRELEVNFLFNGSFLALDSVQKGSTLGIFDSIEPMTGNEAGAQFWIADPDSSGAIVDPNGYSHLMTLFFTSLSTLEPMITYVEPVPLTLVTNNETVILPAEVFSQLAQIDISADRIITFADTTLESAVRNASGVYDRDLRLSDVLPLTRLEASDIGIVSLAGIEELVNLRYLNLGWNQINNISPLAQLPVLDTLFLNDNVSYVQSGGTITDFTPLASMTSLRFLSLDQTYISDITPLTALSSLVELRLKHNSIASLPDMSQMTGLRVLDLSNLIDWSGGNQLTNISPLASLTGLRILDLSWNYSLSDISALASLTNLTHLYAEYALISELGPLSPLINLSVLDLDGNMIADASPLVANSGIASGDIVFIRNNPLSQYGTQCDEVLPTLINRGVTVYSDCAY